MGRSEELEIALQSVLRGVYVPLAWNFEAESVLKKK